MNDIILYLAAILSAVTFCTTICWIQVLSSRIDRKVAHIKSKLYLIELRIAGNRLSYLGGERRRLLREGRQEEAKEIYDLIKQEIHRLNKKPNENE